MSRPLTTPTGVPIEPCVCGLAHPITRGHCVKCGRPTLLLEDGRCAPGCPPQDKKAPGGDEQ